MRIFIAGASADRHKIGALIESLPAYQCTGYNWTTHPGYDDLSRYNPIMVAGDSVSQIRIADALILHVSSTPSPGATGEALIAHLSGKPVVVWPDVDSTKSGIERIPAENIWAHWLAAHYTCVDSFEHAMLSLIGTEARA